MLPSLVQVYVAPCPVASMVGTTEDSPPEAMQHRTGRPEVMVKAGVEWVAELTLVISWTRVVAAIVTDPP
jgi:hypothetical protein